jgi:hypothetical protein
MRSFTVIIEVPDPALPPGSWEGDIRAAVERGGGSELTIGGLPSPHPQFSFVIDADDTQEAETKGQDIVRSVFGRFTWGIVSIVDRP